jgi:hypothetical protein
MGDGVITFAIVTKLTRKKSEAHDRTLKSMEVIQQLGPCLERSAVIYLPNAFTDGGC